MKLLILLFLILFTELTYSKTVCTYLYNCAQCVTEVATDPSIKITTGDIKCLDTLKSLTSLSVDIPRNRNELDNSPLSLPTSGMSDLAQSSLAVCIEQSYQTYNENNQIELFYKELPSVLQTRHEDLIKQLKEEEATRSNNSKEQVSALKSNAAALLASISTKSIQSNAIPQSTNEKTLNQIGLKQELQDVEKQLKAQEIHGNFPNVFGTTIEDQGGREFSRNKEIKNPDDRKLHSQILGHSQNFSELDADKESQQLIKEARDLRLGKAGQLPLTERVQSFELSMAYVQDQRSILQDRIKTLSDPSTQLHLETTHEVSGQLLNEGRDSFYSGDLDEGEHWTDIAKQVVDIGLGFVPIVSTGKDFLEAITGKNYVTGETLDVMDRAFCSISVATLGTGRLAKNAIKVFDKLSGLLIGSKKIVAAEVLSKNVIQKEASLFRQLGEDYWQRWETSRVLGRGSSADIAKGTTKPRNLKESLAIREAISNPTAGIQVKKISMNDPRWPASDGWVKMQQTIRPKGFEKEIEIRYVKNNIDGAIDDFKIKLWEFHQKK